MILTFRSYKSGYIVILNVIQQWSVYKVKNEHLDVTNLQNPAKDVQAR